MAAFSEETLLFLHDLAKNNRKDWFDANRQRYYLHVRDAAKAFSEALSQLLATQYKTRVTHKVFRIYRDLRFSNDKTPYNSHVHMSFTDHATGAAWMVGLQSDHLVTGFGTFSFKSSSLESWRKVVAGPQGEVLISLLHQAVESGLRVNEPELKRVPRDWSADHPHAELLRRKGIVIWDDHVPLSDILGPKGPDRIVEALHRMAPLRDWMTLSFSVDDD